MSVRIFYSWQSDRKQNRNFIRSALDAAIKELRQDLTLEEPTRNIVADQDTQDVPGTPAIADTILTKIRSADVFVADLTFVASGEPKSDARQLPNPNVMLEYGYALHSLGDSKIIGVFNEAHGSPKDLPFDLAHRRWPIRFNLRSDDGSARDTEKKNLKDALKLAVRSIIAQFDEAPQVAQAAPAPFIPAEPGDGVGRLRPTHDYLCVPSDQQPIWLRTGPYLFLRLMPTSATQELGEVETYKIAQSNLQPLGAMRGGSWSAGRHASGSVVYWALREEPTIAWDASQVFLTREIWANDFYHIITPDRANTKKCSSTDLSILLTLRRII
jgi:hypothetical protein